MLSSQIGLGSFGGQFYKSVKSQETLSLPFNQEFGSSLFFFFGINKIECSLGESINLLAIEGYNFDDDGRLQSLLFTFET